MIHYIVEYYLSYNGKWLELKTLSTLSEAEEFLIERFDNIAELLDESDDGSMSIESLMKTWKKLYRIVEMEIA